MSSSEDSSGEPLVTSGGLLVIRPSTTLRTQAVDKLRQAMMSGYLLPGTRLTERGLCEMLGVSRTLVRESLRQLEAEGWIENLPYRGPIVSTISSDEARQLYEIRAVLEGWAAMQCARRATDEDLGALAGMVQLLEAAEQTHDSQDLHDQLEKFHEKLLSVAGNAMLKTYLDSLRGRMRWLRSISLKQPGRIGQTVAEKHALVAALKERKGEKARRTREKHILEAGRLVAAALKHNLS